MKKIGIIAGVLIIFIILGIFLIKVKEEETDVTKSKTKVGLILNGNKDDHSWCQSHFEGLGITAENLNLEIIYRENVPEDIECENIMKELIEEGCKIIIVNSFGYGDFEYEIAKEYPEVYFYHATGIKESNNMCTYFGRIYQMRFLSGIVAGLQTKTNEIGYVAAFPISEVNRGINAFTLGVKAVNPNANVYIEWSNTWIENEATKLAAENLFNNHNIDVVTMHTDSLEVLKLAEERGIWSIGYNIDNSELFPNTFLTAPVWHWENFYEPQILLCLQGKFRGKHFWEGVETGVISLSPLTGNVNKGTEEIVNKYKEMLEKGSFDVFYGPIKDNKGEIRINEKESMTDFSMLNEFDWYVEGVVINEK